VELSIDVAKLMNDIKFDIIVTEQTIAIMEELERIKYLVFLN
jgi:hypothetical protein